MINPEYKLDSLNIENLKNNIFAGNCTITIQSTATLDHYTYKIRSTKNKENPVYFVSVLTAGDQYTYFASIFESKELKITPKSKMNSESKCFLAFKFFFLNLITNNQTQLSKLNIYHSGTCSKCGRKLTTPESVKLGIGPFCANR